MIESLLGTLVLLGFTMLVTALPFQEYVNQHLNDRDAANERQPQEAT